MPEVYGKLDTTVEVELEVNIVPDFVDDELVVKNTVVPLIIVIVLVVLVELDRLPLFTMGDAETLPDCEDEVDNEDEGDDDLELPEVLVALVKEALDDGVADVLDVVLVLLENNMVVVDRKTPLLYVNELLVVPLSRQEAGIVKQHGKPLDEVVVGSKTPL